MPMESERAQIYRHNPLNKRTAYSMGNDLCRSERLSLPPRGKDRRWNEFSSLSHEHIVASSLQRRDVLPSRTGSIGRFDGTLGCHGTVFPYLAAAIPALDQAGQ